MLTRFVSYSFVVAVGVLLAMSIRLAYRRRRHQCRGSWLTGYLALTAEGHDMSGHPARAPLPRRLV